MVKEGTLGAVKWIVTYNDKYALVRVINPFANYDKTNMVTFGFFIMDAELMNYAVSTAIKEMEQESWV